MKIFLSILLLLPVIVFGQWTGSPGEYVNLLLNTSTHRAYTIDNSVPTIVSSPTNVVSVAGGPHSACLIDNLGNVYCKGQNPNGVVPNGTQADQGSFVICMTDNLGNTLDPVVQVFLSGNANKGAFWNVFAVTSTGELYGAGELESYVQGDGTAGTAVNTRWRKINVGSGTDTFVVKVQGGYGMLAQTAAGSAYTWGADRDGFVNGQGVTTAATTPTKVSLPGGKTALDIASNGLVHAIVLSDGTKAMTGSQNLNDYTGIYPTAMTRSFQDVTTALNLPAAAKAVSMNSSTTYWILTTGAMWSHGDNSCGTIGNGDMLDWGAYKCCPGPSSGSPAPYNYDNGFHEHMVITPVEPVPGKRDWMYVTTCASNSWFAYGNDSTGRFYTWGRNKFGPLVNRIIGANPVNGGIGAQYPDSWSIPWVTQQFPNPALAYVQSTSPFCLLNPSGTPCNTYTPPANVKPTAVLSTRAYGTNAIILDASGSSDDVYIMSFLHTQLTGAALQLQIRTGQIDTVYNVAAGTYSFKVKVTDNGFLTDSTTSTVSVGGGNKYYFAAAGSDGNVCSLISPCRSISKLNSLVVNNDTAYFNGLDSFPGSMVIPSSGIYVSSYGTGQPVFSGLVSLSAWSSLGGNIYSANCSGCNANTNLLTYDGVQQTLARYPNSSTGYRSYSAFVPNTSISDATLSGTPNWTGGLLAIRNYHFVLTTNQITNHSGTTITYTPQDPSLTSSTASLGYGYFILGDSLAIDTAREYWYSVPTGKMKYYSLTSPSGHAIYTTGVDTLVRLVDGISNVTLNNIKFIYSGIYGVYVGHDTNTTISNCTFQFNGEIGIMNRGGVGTRILNNTITESNDAGIYIINTPDSSKNVFVYGNTIKRTGLLPGQARDQHAYMHIWSAGLNDSLFNNVLDSCGSNGIMAYNYKSVKYNSINSALMVLDDAGGIYSLGYTDTTRTQFIVKNVVTNCLGNVRGTADLSNQAYGIYLDNNNFGVSVDSNSIYNITHGGFYLHNSRSCKFINNTVYQNANQTHVIYQGDDNTKPIKNNLIKNNIFGVGGASCNIYAFINGAGVQFTGTSGTIDSNYYLYASTANPFFIYNSGSMTMAYKRWQDSTGDSHGVILAAPTFFQYNNTSSSVPVALTKNYYDVLYKSYYNSTTLPPLGSLMLFPGSFVVYPYGLRLKAF